jgi:hypothetical protein
MHRPAPPDASRPLASQRGVPRMRPARQGVWANSAAAGRWGVGVRRYPPACCYLPHAHILHAPANSILCRHARITLAPHARHACQPKTRKILQRRAGNILHSQTAHKGVMP